MALGALLGVVALLLHSFTDFNLRIPANAVYFMTLFALARAHFPGGLGAFRNLP